ncbi:uncharacterized protein LOC106664420 [Cimex lectularius]|uniref:Ionotropic glutamate receptor C-terminal domain-containing protein n=1 Tax=Cimex lectularius TaxID=79782 RepID=A0A8I6STP4_CIMLE|nr:uncharacterized protein LOC106664420 [Cimex lectularius]
MFGDEVKNSDYADTILQLDWPKMLINSAVESRESLKGLFILIPNSDLNVYSRFFKTAQYNSLQYLIITKKFHDVVNNFELMWSFRLLDVAALYVSETGLYVLTFFPFNSNGCSDTFPIRINTWNKWIKGFAIEKNIFSRKRKLYNLHGCSIKVSLQDRSLSELYQQSINGVSIKLFQTIKKFMNFSTLIVEMDREANAYAAAYFNFSTAVIQSVLKGQSDIGVGIFSQLLDYDPNILSPVQLNVDCFTWAVPVKAGAMPSIWTMYAFEFDYYTWCALIVNHVIVWAFFHVVFYLYKSQEDRFTSKFSSLYLFAIYLNVSVDPKPTSNALRMFYINWLFFCFVMTSAYQASMGSFVTVPPDSTNIGSVAELLKTNLTLTGDPKMYHVLSASSETSDAIKEVLKRFEMLLPGDFNDVVYRLIKERNFAVFYTKEKLELAEEHVMLHKNVSKGLHIIPGCTITSHNSAIIMKKDSLYNEPFRYVMTSLLESGIVNHWEKSSMMREYELSKGKEMVSRKFSLLHAKCAFIIFATGILFATTTFIAEFLTKGIKHQSKLKHKNQN